MSALVEMHREGEIAVIVVDNPPVNALKHKVRLGIQDAFLKANTDNAVSAIVLTCAGRMPLWILTTGYWLPYSLP